MPAMQGTREQGIDDTNRYGDQLGNEQRVGAGRGDRGGVDCTESRADDSRYAHDAKEAPQSFACHGGNCGGHFLSTLARHRREGSLLTVNAEQGQRSQAGLRRQPLVAGW
jgi:hypothetical protein